ncbi:Protoheme IX farnesyltransferase, mitochondrial [Tulasnella sp. 403]|nr:Protoheme IX farnesyltransferase, mitochondrial [Tulasnella sp. 403]
MSGVALSPLPATLPVLLATAAGTTLCSASANTINQIVEAPLDAQMGRTRNRPLVRKAISPLHAAGFAVVTGIAGPTILWTMVNPFTAGLGLFNLVLYAGIYTPMKRISVVNTWVGAVVGGIPPLMGWTACGGHILPSATHPIGLTLPPFLTDVATPALSSLNIIAHATDNPLSALVLFIFLFSWQFPHFNALSYLVRSSYAQGGYKMLAVTSPVKNALVSFRHAVVLTMTCSLLAPIAGLTTWAFALTSLVPNALLLRHSWRFWRRGGEKEAKRLWHTSLWYLPVVLGLMMVHKNGASWSEWLGIEESEHTKKVGARP